MALCEIWAILFIDFHQSKKEIFLIKQIFLDIFYYEIDFGHNRGRLSWKNQRQKRNRGIIQLLIFVNPNAVGM